MPPPTPDAVLDVAVAIDEWLHEGVVRRLAGDEGRHRQEALRIERVRVEPGAGSGADVDVGDVVRPAHGLVDEVVVLEGQQAARVDDPRAFHDADLLLGFGARSGCRRRVRGKECARVLAFGGAVAEVQEHRAHGRERDLAEAFVPHALVRRQLAVLVGAVLARVLRAVVRPVEKQLVRQDRAADAPDEPGAILLVARRATALQVGGHVVVLELITDLAGIPVRARLADRVDREAARAIEVHRPGAGLGRGDLRDVVRGGLG